MKRTIIALSIALAASHISAQKVVLTAENHALKPDVINQMALSEWVEPGNAGNNQVWDLRSMEKKKDFQGSVFSAGQRDPHHWFPESNLVLNEFGNMYYFRLDGDLLKSYGMVTRGGNLVVRYDQPYVKMKFPLAYGESVSGPYSGTYQTGNMEIPVNGTYRVEADGAGRLLLPNGLVAEKAIRVKSHRVFTKEYSSHTAEVEILTYRWYNNMERYPLAVLSKIVSTANGRSSTTYQAAYREHLQLATERDLPVTGLEASLSVYPNPFRHEFSLSFQTSGESQVYLELFDNSGRKVADLIKGTFPAGEHSHQFSDDVVDLTEGIYFVRGTIGNRAIVETLVRQ